ncbi:MAG TPA: hypothetical protein VGH54_14775 [Mycobacterium sp.]|uniref:hypothetical protein n=1 Tax=Mycobacterium sp. TaxID=1785 RepID=UPI002F3E7F53
MFSSNKGATSGIVGTIGGDVMLGGKGSGVWVIVNGAGVSVTVTGAGASGVAVTVT